MFHSACYKAHAFMISAGTLILWTVFALVAFAAWHLVGKPFFSAESRERRRRRRNHRPAVRKGSGPAVKLAARVDR